MPTWDIEFRHGGVGLRRLGLWLDVQEPQTGPEKVFVSHAHADHVGAHREVILSAPTARLMQARLSGQRVEHVLGFGEARRFDDGPVPFQITLLPAGHIFGSAMAFLEAEDQTLLYTGDFKLRRGLSAEPCTPRHADLLIMETTYGRPQYQFPPTEDVLRGVVRFCREAIDNDETAVLLGYSLGKSQELLCGLAEANLPIMLHGTVFKLTQIYEQFGQCFPKYERYEAGRAQGKVLLCPPNVAHSAMLRNLGPRRLAVLTGWAVDANCRFRYGADAAFALSDHADFTELVAFVKQVAPRKIFTLHGFAVDFAQTLRNLGFEASALSEDEQMALPLSFEGSKFKVQSLRLPPDIPAPPAPLTPPGSFLASNSFAAFAETSARVAATSSKLEKVRLLAEHLRTVEALAAVATWFTGTPFPASQNRVLQLGWALLGEALCAVSGLDAGALRQVYLKS